MMTNQVLYNGQRMSFMRSAIGIEYIACGDGAVCVPIDSDGNILMIKELAQAPGGKDMFLLPGGAVEPDEVPEIAANRELQEEVGFKAERIDFLGKLRPWKYLDATVHVHLARDLSESHLQGDEEYEIIVERFPLVSFEDFIVQGQLQDSSTIAALYMAKAFIQNGG